MFTAEGDMRQALNNLQVYGNWITFEFTFKLIFPQLEDIFVLKCLINGRHLFLVRISLFVINQ